MLSVWQSCAFHAWVTWLDGGNPMLSAGCSPEQAFRPELLKHGPRCLRGLSVLLQHGPMLSACQLLLWLKERALLLAAFGNIHGDNIIRPPLASVLENPLWKAFGPVLNMLSESWKSRAVELPPLPSHPTSALPIPQSQMADI